VLGGRSHVLYRAVRAMPDGKPELGESASTLGVRVPGDIEPDEIGLVGPGRGGLSVTPDDLAKLPESRLPRELGGRGNQPVWSISLAALGPDLTYRPDPDDPDRHGFVEPAYNMTQDDYRKSIAVTRDEWVRVFPPES
jgi:hypothetical protein